jgi:hypothetical protein
MSSLAKVYFAAIVASAGFFGDSRHPSLRVSSCSLLAYVGAYVVLTATALYLL